MVLHAHLKKTHYYTWGLVFDVPSETPPPPGLVKDQGFSGFFLLPSLSREVPLILVQIGQNKTRIVRITIKNDQL